jgi:hypothetical protein
MEGVKGIVGPNPLDLLAADGPQLNSPPINRGTIQLGLPAIASLPAQARPPAKQARRTGLWLKKLCDEVGKCGFRN